MASLSDGSNYGQSAYASDAMDDKTTANMTKFMIQFTLEYVAFMFIAIAGQAAMAYATAEMYAAREPSWSACLKKGFTRWCDIFGAAFLVGFGMGVCNIFIQLIAVNLLASKTSFLIFLGFLLLVAYYVVIVYVMVSLVILTPVIMVEGTGPIKSIKRCWELSWDNRCYIFCTAFCLSLVYYAFQLVLYLLLSAIGGTEAVFSWWGALVLISPSIIYLPLVVIAETVVYFNIRVQHEGMNNSVLVRELYEETVNSKETKYDLVESQQFV
eukprot:CAMPEP_0178746464 /NCGR_PEP_ID=MMETSP0744-20121128/7823_1 /TAXON_ID=913974 /ORGANISM="Nitzschia punctata, Strain CCMP561" /LENGTH=268 /DNA_ID=CAMNT_0020399677 /DNA_START=340 /DNA_END=1146 /DNA_ORIENTATION=+